MSARLLTPEEVRDTLGPKAVGLSDDQLTEIARRVAVIASVFFDWAASGHAHVPQPDVPSVTR